MLRLVLVVTLLILSAPSDASAYAHAGEARCGADAPSATTCSVTFTVGSASVRAEPEVVLYDLVGYQGVIRAAIRSETGTSEVTCVFGSGAYLIARYCRPRVSAGAFVPGQTAVLSGEATGVGRWAVIAES